MSTPILATKLYIPSLRPHIVLRPRLIERLNEGLHDKLTLISAPAGFGKTTLVSEWVASCGRLVIATREDPNLPLARLHARGHLTELRAADLRFTPSEAAEFFNQMMGLNLSTKDVVALEIRTEGWIAGLHRAIKSTGVRSPFALGELILSVWLIVKGFNSSAIASESA
jgi:ATP/maltotriose-dependent transcriptional regulator MalT